MPTRHCINIDAPAKSPGVRNRAAFGGRNQGPKCQILTFDAGINIPISDIQIKKVFLVFVVYLSMFISPSCSWAYIRLPSIIANNMVLQQKKAIQIWGWADPGEKVKVEPSWQKYGAVLATADQTGEWHVRLPAERAGGPYTLSISGTNTIVLSNILIGEVWVCSGQSNMQFSLSSAIGGKKAINEANYPQIRLFKVPLNYSLSPNPDVVSAWEVCNPQTAGNFSAVGFFFGLDLYNQLGIPIGLIDSAVGGTAAELWTPYEAIEAKSEFQPILDRWEKTDSDTKEIFEKGVDFDLQFDNIRFIPHSHDDKELMIDDFNDGNFENLMSGQLGKERFNPADGATYDIIDTGSTAKGNALRFYGLMRGGQGYPLSMSFNADVQPSDLSDYEGICFDVRGKGFFRLTFIQPTIVDWDDYSSKIKKASPNWEEVTVKFKDLRQAGWGVRKPFTPQQLTKVMFKVEVSNRRKLACPPSSLYNGMIAPLVQYPIRGAIWYQGESNASRAYQYRTLLPALISGWRDVWGQGDFSFLIVQLANFRKRNPLPGEDTWAELREAQLMALDLPNTGLAVSIDIGDPLDIHPKNKKDVGHRLALWALANTYGKDIVHSGPLYESMEIIGNRIKIHFKHAGDYLVSKDASKLKGFAIAGKDRKFYWAEAEIEKNTVIVYSHKVQNPVAVRYAWAANPQCNLYNSSNLPASPFRTDTWPGITKDRN